MMQDNMYTISTPPALTYAHAEAATCVHVLAGLACSCKIAAPPPHPCSAEANTTTGQLTLNLPVSKCYLCLPSESASLWLCIYAFAVACIGGFLALVLILMTLIRCDCGGFGPFLFAIIYAGLAVW